MPLPVTSLFASIFGLIIMWLTWNVVKLRTKHKVSIGSISNKEYDYKNGALTNLTSTLPVILILMALAEAAGFCWISLVCIGLAYLTGRLTHIYSLYRYEAKTSRFTLRVIGMITTFTVIIILASINFYLSYSALSIRLTSGVVDIAFRVLNLYTSAFS